MAVVFACRFRGDHADETFETDKSGADLLDINAASGLESARFRCFEGRRRRRGDDGLCSERDRKMLITLQLCVAYETPRTGPDMSFGGSIHNLPGPGFATDEN